MMASLRNISEYHFSVQPPHFALVLELLKLKTIRTAIGA